MATTFAALRTRLYARLGVTTASTAEQDLCNEALNAALSKAATAGAPQLRQVYTGVIPARLSTTVTAHSASSANVTLNSVLAVYPGDILQDTANSTDYIIRTVNSSTKVVGVGIPITGSINGNSVTVIRRSFPLPVNGQVIEIREVNGPRDIKFDPMAPAKCTTNEGTALYYTQGYAENLAVSYVNLWPAPAAGDQFTIIQNTSYAEDASVDMSEPLISYVLAEALKYRWAMSLQSGYAGAAAMADDLKELRQKAAGGSGVITRG